MGSHSKGRFKACTEDRISGLPNEILCHILSFLETDVVVKTSFLSHRWKNVWTKAPTITLWDFDYRNSFYRDRFGEFVDHVLLSHGSSDIHTFQLHCSEFEDDSRFDAWICAAVERNVVELEFSVPCYLCEESRMDWEDWLYEFPRSLYMCKTLVVLKLRLLSVITITPTLDCFPSLKTQGCPPPTAVTNPFRCGSSPKGGKQLATKCAPFPWAGIELPTSWLRDEVSYHHTTSHGSAVSVHNPFAELLKVKDLPLSAKILGERLRTPCTLCMVSVNVGTYLLVIMPQDHLHTGIQGTAG
ncbi:unnamed protein product [Prunus armeniaca]